MHRLTTANQPIPFPSAVPTVPSTERGTEHAAGLSTCAWCQHSYRTVTGFGVFCSRACFQAEAEEGTGAALRTRDEVEADRMAEAMAGRTALTDTLILSILKAQTARIERLEKQVAGLEGRERV
jgi:hypothetical protein